MSKKIKLSRRDLRKCASMLFFAYVNLHQRVMDQDTDESFRVDFAKEANRVARTHSKIVNELDRREGLCAQRKPEYLKVIAPIK